MAFQKSKVTNFGRGRTLAGFEYCHQNSTQAGETISASELADGELAMNSADGVLFYRNSGGSVGQFPSATGFKRIVSLTQSAYDALTPDADTLYVVTPNPT